MYVCIAVCCAQPVDLLVEQFEFAILYVCVWKCVCVCVRVVCARVCVHARVCVLQWLHAAR